MSRQRFLISQPINAIAFCGLLFAAAALVAQSVGPLTPDMSWSTIDGGGGTSLAMIGDDAIEITGTIGQTDAHTPGVLAGGNFEFTPAFWKGAQPHYLTCPADVSPAPNGDNLINVDDLLAVITSWGPAAGQGDVDRDGDVDVDDLLAVIIAWGTCG